MNGKLEQAKEIVKKYNQEQLFVYYDKLSEENKQKLLDQITTINFDQILTLYENTKQPVNLKDCKVEPISYIDKEKVKQEEKDHYIQLGVQTIKEGKYAVATMAGGQGTRLRT